MTKKFNYVVATATTIAMLASATPAFAWGNNGGDVDVENKATIEVSNWGTVVNTTTSSASTGGNWAGGSEGGNGSMGGDGEEGGNADADADADDNGDADADATGGNGGNGGKGGNGGNGGLGGQIQTGDATAEAGTVNTVNTNDLAIEGCGCDAGVDYDEDNVDDISVEDEAKIKLSNGGFVVNYTDAHAKTGFNWAAGSEGGNGSMGGDGEEGGNADADADADAGYHGDDADADADAVGGEGGNGGKGGNGGTGAAGGLVITGAAHSVAGTINVVNTNLVRITR
jgi:hypothetical protein